MNPTAISSLGVPVLCIDTCSILDIMRDPTREGARPHERHAAIDLVTHAEAGRLVCLIAQQVNTEFADHDLSIQEEATRTLTKLRLQIDQVNRIAAIYGSPSTVSFEHLDDHVVRARAVVERWLTQLAFVTPSSAAPGKAFARMNAGIAPAKRGKESSKDCLVYETYLEAAGELRAAGLTTPIVFLSSNTNEYLEERRIVKPEISTEFSPLAVSYSLPIRFTPTPTRARMGVNRI